MIKNALKSYKNDNRGSAIVTGLVVSAVLMVLCLSLLLVSYSLFISTSKNASEIPNRELLYSAAEALEHELTDLSIDIDKLATDGTLLNDHALWKEIYDSIWKGFGESEGATSAQTDISGNFVQASGFWPYYNPNASDGVHSDVEKCSRYFNMTSAANRIIVQLYWELPKNWDGDFSKKNGTLLNAVYRLYNSDGEVLVKTTKKYKLSVDTTTVNVIVEETNPGGSSSGGTSSGNTSSGTGSEGTENATERPKTNFDHRINPTQEDVAITMNVSWANYPDPDNSTGFGGNIKITNTSSQTLENWKFYLYSDCELNISGDMQAELVSPGKYKLSNRVYNQDLAPGGSESASFTAANTATFDKLPTAELIVSSRHVVDNENEKAYKVNFSYGSNNKWSYTGLFTITNVSDKPLEDWQFSFTFDREINGTNGYPIDHNGNMYYVSHPDGNAKNIPVGGYVSFQISGSNDPGTTIMPGNYQLYAFVDGEENITGVPQTTWKWNRIGSELLGTGGESDGNG